MAEYYSQKKKKKNGGKGVLKTKLQEHVKEEI